eukprot:GFYU01007907.1.p1 GENE.GFYU01007907.1~~GFYU01007907.1.p1  ORF type:complete len:669 (-),score=77.03 GFYU01007907.1:192-2198(-)
MGNNFSQYCLDSAGLRQRDGERSRLFGETVTKAVNAFGMSTFPLQGSSITDEGFLQLNESDDVKKQYPSIVFEEIARDVGGDHEKHLTLDGPRLAHLHGDDSFDDEARMLSWTRVCRAFTVVYPDVGYVSNIGVLVAFLLHVTTDEETAFWVLVTLCDRHCFGYFIRLQVAAHLPIDSGLSSDSDSSGAFHPNAGAILRESLLENSTNSAVDEQHIAALRYHGLSPEATLPGLQRRDQSMPQAIGSGRLMEDCCQVAKSVIREVVKVYPPVASQGGHHQGGSRRLGYGQHRGAAGPGIGHGGGILCETRASLRGLCVSHDGEDGNAATMETRESGINASITTSAAVGATTTAATAATTAAGTSGGTSAGTGFDGNVGASRHDENAGVGTAFQGLSGASGNRTRIARIESPEDSHSDETSVAAICTDERFRSYRMIHCCVTGTLVTQMLSNEFEIHSPRLWHRMTEEGLDSTMLITWLSTLATMPQCALSTIVTVKIIRILVSEGAAGYLKVIVWMMKTIEEFERGKRRAVHSTTSAREKQRVGMAVQAASLPQHRSVAGNGDISRNHSGELVDAHHSGSHGHGSGHGAGARPDTATLRHMNFEDLVHTIMLRSDSKWAEAILVEMERESWTQECLKLTLSPPMVALCELMDNIPSMSPPPALTRQPSN